MPGSRSRIVPLEGLSPRQALGVAPLFTLDGGPLWDVPFFRRLHALGTNFVDYHGVYAVRGDRVLAQVQVIEMPFTTSRGVFRAAGLDYVVAHPGAVREGLAARLVEEVHRRETERGTPWVFLWTRRSWGAHRLYERAGYHDLFSFASALHAPGGARPRSPPPGYRFRAARASDAGLLQRLLEAGTAGRWGFCPRPQGSFRWRFRLGWRRPRDHRVLLHRGRPVGYAQVLRTARALSVQEVLVDAEEHRGPMLRMLQGLEARRWLVLERTTFVPDVAPLLREEGGWDVHPIAHPVLMGRPLGPPGAGALGAAVRRAFRDRRFSCHAGDMF